MAAVDLNAVAAGLPCVLCAVCEAFLDLMNLIDGKLMAGSGLADHLGGQCGCGNGAVTLIVLGSGLAAGVIELAENLAAVLMYALCKDAHCVAVIERAQMGLAAHGDAAKLRADNCDVADDNEAAAAFCLCRVVFDRAGGNLAACLAEGIVHRRENYSVGDDAAVDASFGKQFFVHLIHSIKSIRTLFSHRCMHPVRYA